MHLSRLWEHTELLDEAVSIAEALDERIENDSTYDVIGGAAGCLAVLLELYGHTQSPAVLATAVRCGDWLIRNASESETGVGWIASGGEDRPLAGFSHGIAGIAWALIKLYGVTGDVKYRKVAEQAIATERSLFCPDAGNWRDLRDKSEQGIGDDIETFMTAWCNGAPGIGLGRTAIAQWLNDPYLTQEVEIAAATTLSDGMGDNHSLCHGDLGNLELLLRATDVGGNPKWRQAANAIATRAAREIVAGDVRCGVPMHLETPGLMAGLAGIGHGLLRVARPDAVGSVLVLE